MELNPGITNNWIVFIGEAAFATASLFFLSLLLSVKRRTQAGRFFWWLILCMFYWTTLGFISDLTANLVLGFWTGQASFIGPAFIPLLFLLFANALKQKPRIYSKTQLGLFSIPAIVTLGLTFTDLNIIKSTYVLESSGYSSKVGPLFIGFLVYLLGYVFVAAKVMLTEYRTTRSKLKKLQLSYVVIGAIGGTIIISITHLILPTFLSTDYYPIGAFGAIFFSSLVVYAVFRHRFLDTRRALTAILGNFLTFISAFLIYGLVALGFLSVIGVGEILPAEQVVIGSILLVTVTLPWIWPRLRGYWLKTLLPATPKPSFTLPSTDKNLLDLGTLGQTIQNATQSVVSVKSVSIFVKDKAEGPYNCVWPRGNQEKIPVEEIMARYFSSKPKLLVREEVPFIREELGVGETEVLEKVVERMESMSADVAIPLASGELYGFVLLGEKTDGKAFTAQDLQLLTHVQTEATMALMNVIIYKSALRQAGVKV